MALLEVRNLSVRFGGLLAIESLSVEPGETVSIIGRNGVGKSTLLATIMGHTTLHGGRILLKGQDISRTATYRRVGAGLGLVPQEREIFPSLSVRENLEVATRPGFWTQQTVFELFPRLAERRTQPAGTLSGGEQQMLAIGRALMARPKLLLLDEPSMGLAPLLVEEIYRTIRALKQQGATILLVEQNAHAALAVADRAYVMETGAVVLSGSGRELLANDRVRAAYLGG